MGTHQKLVRSSPAHGFISKKFWPMGWAGLGQAQPIRTSGLVHDIDYLSIKEFCERSEMSISTINFISMSFISKEKRKDFLGYE
jgi:hypothetical protein